MRVYMIRNIETGEWFFFRSHRVYWTDKQHIGFVTNFRGAASSQITIYNLNRKNVEIVEFEAKEIK